MKNEETGETESDRINAARAERLAEMGLEDDQGKEALEAPQFVPGADFFWQAFTRLSKGRQIGFSVGAISFMDMVRYCSFYGYKQVDDFESIIGAVDEYFLATLPKSVSEDGSGKKGIETGADGSRELTGDDAETHERRWLG